MVLSRTAKLYIGLILAAGAALVGSAVANWQCSSVRQFVSCLLLTLVGSLLKIKLPGITGTYSFSSLFLLIGITSLSRPELVIVACAAACIQCLWCPQRRPLAVQVLFSMSSLALAVVAVREAVLVSRNYMQLENPIALFALAGTMLYVLNTGALAIMLALVANQPIRAMWEHWVWSSFPYHLAGSLIAAGLRLSTDWVPSALALPLFIVLWLWYGIYIRERGRTPFAA